MQTRTYHSYGFTAIFISIFGAFLLLNGPSLNAQNIGLFYHKDYVQIEEGNLFAEGSNLHSTLRDFDYDLEFIEEFSAQKILESDIIIIPELERKNLYLDLSSKQKQDLESYVSNGGGLIISGVVAPNEANNNNAIDLLNGVYGFNLKSEEFTLTGFSNKNQEMDFGAFSNTPDEIPNNNAIAFLTGGLPDDSTIIYTDKEGTSNSSVVIMNYGEGHIIYLGWGWWNAIPHGSQDGGWIDILKESIDLLLCSKPSLEGASEFSFDLPSNKELQIPFQALNLQTDVCTEEYEISLSQEFFNCDHIGTQEIIIELEDNIGRKANKSILITINDPDEVCAAVASYVSISGKVLDRNGKKIKQANVELFGESSYNAAYVENGDFVLDNVLIENEYTVSAKKDDDPFNGITTLDLVLISKHILGNHNLNSPYELIAADINNNGQISVEDILELRKMILYQQTDFSNHDSWQVISNLMDLSDPLSQVVDEPLKLDFDQVSGSLDFTAVKIGDLSNNAIPGREAHLCHAEDQSHSADELISLKLNSNLNENMQGFQIALNIPADTYEFLDCTTALKDFGPANFHYINETLLISYAKEIEGAELDLNIQLKAIKAGRLSSNIKINERAMQAEIYTEELNSKKLNLTFTEKEQAPIQAQSKAIFSPNPFTHSSLISFETTDGAQAVLKVYDGKGAFRNDPHCGQLGRRWAQSCCARTPFGWPGLSGTRAVPAPVGWRQHIVRAS